MGDLNELLVQSTALVPKYTFEMDVLLETSDAVAFV
jgi:hypothetical protein